MTSNGGRRGMDVSQFLANGNTLPSDNDVVIESNEYDDFDDDLSRFTNVDFTEFDPGDIFGGEGSLAFDVGQEESVKRQKVEGQVEENNNAMDFVS
ncbi:MAG: hypothetical protein Q9163_001868, partial [Psora crenata]